MVSLITTVLSGKAKIGDRVFIGVYLNCPYGFTSGVDVILDVSLELAVNGLISTHLLGGDTFNLTKGNHVVFSCITAPGSPDFTGGGLLAVIDCTVVSGGTGKFTFDFTPGATIDCNVASVTNPGTDMLDAVSNREIPL